jgi:hypothetical protein
LIVPYFIGYLNHRKFARELKSLFLKFSSRARTLSSWREGSRYRVQEARKLKDDILKALLSALDNNELLRFFALKLIDDFAEESGTDGSRKSRLAILQGLKFGTRKGFEDDPISEIRSIRERIKKKPFYRWNLPAQRYFEEVEKSPDRIADEYPLLDDCRKLTRVLRAFVDSDTDLEYICEDLRAGERAEGRAIAVTKPGLALSAILGLLPLLYKTFEGGSMIGSFIIGVCSLPEDNVAAAR